MSENIDNNELSLEELLKENKKLKKDNEKTKKRIEKFIIQ